MAHSNILWVIIHELDQLAVFVFDDTKDFIQVNENDIQGFCLPTY